MIEGRIIPRLQRLYDYDVDQPDDRHIIFINLPLPKKPDFDISKINVQLETVENDEDAINIGIEGEMPFVCGVLYHPVNKEYEKEKVNGKLRIKLTQNDETEWQVLITKRNPKNNYIDPKSAFYNFLIYEKSENEEEKKIGKDYLMYAVSSGLTQATRIYGDMLLCEGHREDGLLTLKSAADEYKDPEAQFKIGCIYSRQEKTRKLGYEYLLKAFDQGNSSAAILLGKLLSPLSDMEFEIKDPQKAVYFFEIECAKPEPDGTAIHELAKLEAAGLGITKNVQHALELQALASKLDPNVPNLNQSSYRTKNESFINALKPKVIGAAVATATFGLGLFFYLKRRRH